MKLPFCCYALYEYSLSDKKYHLVNIFREGLSSLTASQDRSSETREAIKMIFELIRNNPRENKVYFYQNGDSILLTMDE